MDELNELGVAQQPQSVDKAVKAEVPFVGSNRKMNHVAFCPTCGAANYSNMFCLRCLDWQIGNYPDPERVEIVQRLKESVMRSATIQIQMANE